MVTKTPGLAFALCLTAWSCASAPLGPVDVEDVSIQLRVSGGFVGQDFTFVVDGGELEVRGIACVSFCEFEAGEVITPISSQLVEILASRLEEMGIFGLGGDYGSQCCDQIDYELTYSRGLRTVQVRGSGELIPEGLIDVIADLVSLSRARVPAIVALVTNPSDWPADAYAIDDVTVDGLDLVVDVEYGGGCSPHAMDLVIWGDWTSSDPPQVNAFISHDARGDMCDALISETRIFDLVPLVRAARARSGINGNASVVLRLWDPVTQNQSARLVRIDY
ncbi:MAG: hypothetical protein OEN56_01575 [Gemmatimonadota bacterium]|nr:hypothetical protein [Gemmatimonadota bacterium]MDH3425023.1 hypothetical protein [Gemmatimonadota bacterium]